MACEQVCAQSLEHEEQISFHSISPALLFSLSSRIKCNFLSFLLLLLLINKHKHQPQRNLTKHSRQIYSIWRREERGKENDERTVRSLVYHLKAVWFTWHQNHFLACLNIYRSHSIDGCSLLSLASTHSSREVHFWTMKRIPHFIWISTACTVRTTLASEELTFSLNKSLVDWLALLLQCRWLMTNETQRDALIAGKNENTRKRRRRRRRRKVTYTMRQDGEMEKEEKRTVGEC